MAAACRRGATLFAASLRAAAPRDDAGAIALLGVHPAYRRLASAGAPRPMSQLSIRNEHAFLVDTLAMVRRFEGQGIPTKHAEVITCAITDVLKSSLENTTQAFLTQGELQKEHHFLEMQRETEKLKNDIEKMRNELRYEVDKVTAGQRLDLNLERGRTRDELAKQYSETAELNNKIDRECNALKAQLEAAKYDVIKYCIGTLVSIAAVSLGTMRILL